VSLAQSLQAAATAKRPRCPLGRLLVDLDIDDARALLDALDGTAYQHIQISAALKSEGHYVNEKAVGRHRAGTCSCDTQ
jgi:hypothetical protein